jgi:energy-coupling factor transporter ATP-binding protein EcfA2
MSRNVATPKQTSGGGFVFESKVAAFYSLFLLTGSVPFRKLGALSKIAFQRRASGWLLDDLILTFGHNDNTVAISIKSNAQFTSKGVPTDIVSDLWEQHLGEVSPVFVSSRDYLCIVTGPIKQALSQDLTSLIQLAETQDPQTLHHNIHEMHYTNNNVRALYDSIICPNKLAKKHKICMTDTGSLLKRLIYEPFDFESQVSQSERQAIWWCQNIVSSGSPEDARTLWEMTIGICNNLRTQSGDIDRAMLVSQLGAICGSIELKDSPDYAGDWEKLRTWSASKQGAISSMIGDSVHVQREYLLKILETAIKQKESLLLLGRSGTGKSAIAKELCQRLDKEIPILWLDSDSLSQIGLACPATNLGLKHSLQDMIWYAHHRRGLIVLDGLQRFISSGLRKSLKEFIQAIRIDENAPKWTLLFICQSDQVASLEYDLSPLQLRRLEIPEFEKDELIGVRAAFPNVGRLLDDTRTSSLMRRPKILDIVANLSARKDISKYRTPVSESGLLHWYWSTIVECSSFAVEQSAVLQKLACNQADEEASATPLASLVDVRSEVIESLMNNGVLLKEGDRLRFEHDVFGDWSRTRYLLSLPSPLQVIREKALNPLWHAAIRLFSVSILEQDNNLKKWSAFICNVPETRDLFLDGVAFGAQPDALLGLLWSEFMKNDGDLLRRFLNRFVVLATLPNWRWKETLQNMGIPPTPESALIDRQPFYSTWMPVLKGLLDHKEDLVRTVSCAIARIAVIWLKGTPDTASYRNELSQLAIQLADSVAKMRLREKRNSDRDVDATEIYKALLSASKQNPDEVGKVCLFLSGRSRTDEVKTLLGSRYQLPGTRVLTHRSIMPTELTVAPPWPLGPDYSPDESFRKVFLHDNVSYQLMVLRPSLCQEIILALLIEKRKWLEKPDRHGHWTEREEFGLEQDHGFDNPLFHKGPFLSFLNMHPKDAIETIIQLTDFATQRAEAERLSHGDKYVTWDLEIGSAIRAFRGDYKIYFWYRGSVWNPDIVSTALMALEFFLYEKIDAKEPVNDYIHQILFHASSIAFIGLLIEVGRYDNALFQAELLPLLGIPDIYLWELKSRHDGMATMTSGIRRTCREWEWNMRRDWFGKEHRMLSVWKIAVRLMLNDEKVGSYIEKRRVALESFEDPEDDGRIRFVRIFDRRHWKKIDLPEGQRRVWRFDGVSLQREERKREQEKYEIQMALSYFPFKCMQIIEGKKVLTEGDIPSFLEQSQQAADLARQGYLLFSTITPEDCLLGTVAVLVKCHWPYLEEHAKQLQWCIDSLTSALRAPLSLREFDSAESTLGFRWDDFAATAIPILWIKNPDSMEILQLAARMVTTFHYSAVSTFVRNCFSARQALGNRWECLVMLIMRWSIIRAKYWQIRNGSIGSFSSQAEIQFLSDVWREFEDGFWSKIHPIRMARRVLKAFYATITGQGRLESQYRTIAREGCRLLRMFCSGRVLGTYIDVEEMLLDTKHRRPSRRHHRIASAHSTYHEYPAFDSDLLSKSFFGIMHPSQALDQEERNGFLSFWESVLKVILVPLRTVDESGNPVDELDWEDDALGEFSFQLLDEIAEVLLEAMPHESPSRFWKPILDACPVGQHFIEHFLEAFQLRGLMAHDCQNFHSLWQGMVSFADSSPCWSLSQRGKHLLVLRLWGHLLGFASYTWVHVEEWELLWSEERSEMIGQMIPSYQRWAELGLGNGNNAFLFVRWLSLPAARPLRVVSLIWILAAAETAEDNWWEAYRKEDIEYWLTKLLWNCWTDAYHDLIQNHKHLDAFRKLLQILVGRQYEPAIYLQQQVGSVSK